MIERMKVMKYKLLLDGRKQNLLKEFFMYGEGEFQCLSTSTYWEDIVAHMDFVEPDAIVCFYDEDDDEILNRLRSLKSYERYEQVPIIVITDEESSMALAKKAYNLIDMTIQRPITTEQLFSMISNFLKNRKPKETGIESDAFEMEPGDPLNVDAILGEIENEVKLHAKKHILVVDDDRSILKMLKSALEQEYDVTTVLNGRMAEKFLETKKTDLILLDYEMPILTGPEVLKKIRKDEETANIPVVFMTGVASRSKIEEVMTLGPQGYLLKPVDMDKLFATIQKILG